MAENDSGSEKTEEPTQKKIEDAFEQGQSAYSRELSNAFFLGLLFLYLIWFIPSFFKEFTVAFTAFISKSYSFSLDENNLDIIFKDIIFGTVAIIGLPIFLSVMVAIFSSFLQKGRLSFATKAIAPQLSRISILSGFKKMFSFKSVFELLKGLAKITVVGFIGYLILNSSLEKIVNLPNYDLSQMLVVIGGILYKIVMFCLIFVFFMGAGDLFYQKLSFLKTLMMTRQELKDELKQSDGDPQIKARIRKLRMQKMAKKNAQEVPKSSVVVRNPTHYAVALKYEEDMQAPIVMAKGKDFIALKIIEIAQKNEIPIVENKPLARSLYENGEIGKEIPLDQYQAVAEVIKYIYQLKGKV
jgi:flagellar biosynthetic protein FlhB